MTRVGGTSAHALDVRIVCATNRNLEDMIEQGGFRRDLYHRLNVGRISIPPLRERPEDILPLAQMVLEDFAARYRRLFRFIGDDARDALLSRSWDGNARELVNTIERAVLLHDAVVLSKRHLALDGGDLPGLAAPDERPVLRPGSFDLPAEGLDLEALEREIVKKALAMCDGNKSKTADYLRISRSALYTRLARQ
jgi:DNA-binding NtrC family response regulator